MTLLIKPIDVIRAKIRAGLHPTISLNRKPSSSIHTDERPHCFHDEDCPCFEICPALPADREFLDITTLIEDDDAAFTDGLHNGYMSFYDELAQDYRPALTCTGLFEFMCSRPLPDYNAQYNMGYIAGLLLALGESNPAHIWRSAEPPAREVRP